MAKDDGFRERRIKEERAKEREALEARIKETLGRKKSALVSQRVDVPASDRFDEVIARASSLLDQVNSHYSLFFVSVENRPPAELRVQLEQVIQQLQLMKKATPAQQFRFQSLLSLFNSQRERWDRTLREIETGKLKRG